LVGEHHGLEDEVELELGFRQAAHAGHQDREVLVDLPAHNGRRVSLGRLQISAVLGAGNLCQTLGGATNRANFRRPGRTSPFAGAFLTQGTGHTRTLSGSPPICRWGVTP